VARAPSSDSTAPTSVYKLQANPRRRLADCVPAAGAERVRQEFKQGEVVPGTRYRVIGLLGVGGMGSVYEVEHTELGKRFVLKALLSELAKREDLVTRLRNEQRALGRLEHPSIVAVTDAGVTEANVPYFVMERLQGETLGARLKRQRRLPLIEALAIAVGVLEGLAAAHEIGVVHRDIKPQNILLVGGVHPKILDFGVAKIADLGRAITARGVAVGTPRYMSPEQASGETVDGRSDLYAVGLLLFEALVGNGPFDDARDANEMLLAHLGREVPRLSTRVRGITPELDQFVAGMLSKQPQSRPPTARAAAASLRTIAQAYGPASEPGARALLGHATQPFGMPVASRPPAPTTHADGIAARGGRRADAVTDAANTLIKGTGKHANTLIDDWGAQRAHDTESASATTEAGSLSGSFGPTGVTRTEILSAVGVPAMPSGTEETRTAVPLTPNDGSRTLHPAPATAQGSRSRGVLLAVAAAALVLGVGGTYVVRSRATPALDTGSAALRPIGPTVAATNVASARATAVALDVREAPSLAAARSGNVAPPVPATPVSAPSARVVVAGAQPIGASPPPRAPAAKPISVARTAKSAPSPSASVAKSSNLQKKAAELRKVPSGLPGSGL
jgi:tRNA A-37 threonylcarbamoyl transferase component Bud32